MPFNDPQYRADLTAALTNPSYEGNVEATVNAIVAATKAYIQSGTITGQTTNGGTLINVEIN